MISPRKTFANYVLKNQEKGVLITEEGFFFWKIYARVNTPGE